MERPWFPGEQAVGISDSPVHLGVQQGQGVLVYQGAPLIETKKGVRAPGNDIRQTFMDAVHIRSHSSGMEGICVQELW